MVISCLPEEMLLEIFTRLPKKSVPKFKLLSKSWLSLLSSPLFLNLWFSRNGKLFLITPSLSLHLVTPTIHNKAVLRKLDLPGSWTRVVGSCNGFILLTDKKNNLYLVNFVTCSMVKIPECNLVSRTGVVLWKSLGVRTHGLGYDSSTNDFKIVTLVRSIETYVCVYSVKRGAWKKAENFPYDEYVPFLSSGVYLNGAIHWQACHISSRYACIIASFDLATGVFYEIVAPFNPNRVRNRLVVRGGRLSLVSSDAERCGVVWTLVKNGRKESWKKFTIAGDDIWGKVRALCFAGEELIVLTTEDKRLASYYVKEETMKEFFIDGVPNVDNLEFLG